MVKINLLFVQLCVFTAIFIFCKQQPVFSQNNNRYDLVKDFGGKADNKTDNYVAFAKAAETLSRAGGGVLNIPRGKYYIASYKIMGGVHKNNITDIIFKNCNNLTIIGNHSVIRLNGNFWRRKDYQQAGVPYNYAYNNSVCVFKLMNCKHVLLKDLTLLGGVNNMRKEEGVVEGESFGIYVADDEPADKSSMIELKNIATNYFASDGILIKSNGQDILIDRCRSYKNARQGLSIVKGKNIRVLNCDFDSTGITGAYGWHGPAAGIDIENEFGFGNLSNVLVKNCNLRGNYGFQIVTNLSSDHVVIDSCFISDLTAGYSKTLNGVGMYSLNSILSNSIIFGSIQVDLSDQIYKGTIEQEIHKNIIYSGSRGIVSADFSRPVNITDNILVMLPKPHLDDYFPYIQNSNCRFNRNIVVVHADRLKKEPKQVTALVQNSKELKEVFWLINGFDIPVEKQKGVYFIPAANGYKLMENQFFSESDIIARFGIDKKNVLTNSQVKKILAAELFKAYVQKSFNLNYLKQANEVRKFTRGIVAGLNK